MFRVLSVLRFGGGGGGCDFGAGVWGCREFGFYTVVAVSLSLSIHIRTGYVKRYLYVQCMYIDR